MKNLDSDLFFIPPSRTTETMSRPVSISPKMLLALVRLQDGLNQFIDVEWRKKRSPDDWGLAITMEAAELIDSYPWKWWKKQGSRANMENVKVELVDILHFSLSGAMQLEGLSHLPTTALGDVDEHVTLPLTDTTNAVRTFRAVMYLAKAHRFDTITQMVIAAAKDLDFDLVGYYVAKHTLNYIRQLGGYKEGRYIKVRQGVEDNELLHACVVQESSSGGGSGDDDAMCFHAMWDKVMANVYEAFSVRVEDRRNTSHWVAKRDREP